jgi:hypothetical protein
MLPTNYSEPRMFYGRDHSNFSLDDVESPEYKKGMHKFGQFVITTLLAHIKDEKLRQETDWCNIEGSITTGSEAKVFGEGSNGCRPGWVEDQQHGGRCVPWAPSLLVLDAKGVLGGLSGVRILSKLHRSRLVDLTERDEMFLHEYLDTVLHRLPPNNLGAAQQWFREYVENVQKLWYLDLLNTFEVFATTIGVQLCTDRVFETEFLRAVDSPQWLGWASDQTKKGRNIAGYSLLCFCRIIKDVIRPFMPKLQKKLRQWGVVGPWNIAKTLACWFAFHPRQVRWILLSIENQKEYMSVWLREYIVKDVLPRLPDNTTKSSIYSETDLLFSAAADPGRVQPQIVRSLLEFDVADRSTQSTQHQFMLFTETFISSSAPFLPKGFKQTLITAVFESLCKCARHELESQLWSEKSYHTNIQFLTHHLDVKKLLESIPEISYKLRYN